MYRYSGEKVVLPSLSNLYSELDVISISASRPSLSGTVHTGVEVYRIDSEMSRLVE